MNEETSDSASLRPNEFRAPVEPARDSAAARPLWSVLIPTFNCAAYLEQTLRSVLEQDPGSARMEILVLDDQSTQDDPRDVVQRVGKGRVEFIQQHENVGKSRNFHTGLSASRGRLIHQLHGDDLVAKDFYRTMEDCFEAFPEAGAFFCEAEYIDERGQSTGRTGRARKETGLLNDWLRRIYVQQRVQSPSIVCRREVFEQLGGFDQRLSAFEDWEMWVRAATQFRFGFNADCTAQYRVYSENTSCQSILAGKRAEQLKRTLDIVDSYVPSEISRRWHRMRSREAAYYLVRCLPLTVKHRSPRRWLALCRHIASHSLHPRVWYHALVFTCGYRRFTP